jgi:hypothetical protein
VSVNRIDQLIAEHVLGWTVFEGDDAIPQSVTSREACSPHLKRAWAKKDGRDIWNKMACLECGDFPAFSENLETAWKCGGFVEKRTAA